MQTYCRGVRGATTVEADTKEAILEATRELLSGLIAENGIAPEDVASVFFTTTSDLTAAFPAYAARELGWHDVALLGATEANVQGAPTRCVRVLIHWNTAKSQGEIRHVYLRGAAGLRPDRAQAHAEGKRGTP